MSKLNFLLVISEEVLLEGLSAFLLIWRFDARIRTKIFLSLKLLKEYFSCLFLFEDKIWPNRWLSCWIWSVVNFIYQVPIKGHIPFLIFFLLNVNISIIVQVGCSIKNKHCNIAPSPRKKPCGIYFSVFKKQTKMFLFGFEPRTRNSTRFCIRTLSH